MNRQQRRAQTKQAKQANTSKPAQTGYMSPTEYISALQTERKRTKEVVVKTVSQTTIAAALWSLENEFGFSHIRIQRFLTEFEKILNACREGLIEQEQHFEILKKYNVNFGEEK